MLFGWSGYVRQLVVRGVQHLYELRLLLQHYCLNIWELLECIVPDVFVKILRHWWLLQVVCSLLTGDRYTEEEAQLHQLSPVPSPLVSSPPVLLLAPLPFPNRTVEQEALQSSSGRSPPVPPHSGDNRGITHGCCMGQGYQGAEPTGRAQATGDAPAVKTGYCLVLIIVLSSGQ